MEDKPRYIRWFDEIAIDDVPLVGGKNASLGEMYRELSPHGVKIPNGFAITAEAYRYLVENANDAIIVLQEGLLRFHNRKTEALLGYSREMLKEKPLRDHLHPEDSEAVTQRFRRLLEGEELSERRS